MGIVALWGFYEVLRGVRLFRLDDFPFYRLKGQSTAHTSIPRQYFVRAYPTVGRVGYF